ncbi:MAG TPA: retroviral-like aspartic protease family protein [Sphingomicrobium sp.]|nr:retroviral-like aspartic protease family protein [Sphingomicrobium sp.]
MLKHCLALSIALTWSGLLSAQTPTTKLDAVKGVPDIDKSSQTQDVQFRTGKDDRMTVPVRLAGAGPYQFLVDTGADRTAVSRELVTQLRLPSSGGAELHSVSGVSRVTTARVNDLELTRPAERAIDAAVLDRANIGADGIVGVDVLRSERVQFDFATQTMSIVPSSTPDFRAEKDTIVVTARRKNGRLIVTDADVDGHRLTVVLDTGSQVSIGNSALRHRLLGSSLIDPQRTVELESVTGEKIIGDYLLIPQITIGGIVLRNLAVVFTDAETFKQLRLENMPSLLLGMNAIRAFKKVSIDFANRKFRVVVPEHSEIDVEVAMRGG